MNSERMTEWTPGQCPPGNVLLDYTDGELPPNQTHHVERHLLDCPLCASAVEGFQSSGSPSADELAHIRNISDLPKSPSTMVATHPTRSRQLLPYLLAAAVALLLAFAAWSYYQQQAPQRVFAQYFDPLPQTDFGSNRAAVRNDEQDELRAQALEYHRSGNYAFALSGWRALLEENEGNPEDFRPYLYAATAALASGKDELAAYYLQQLPPRPEGEFGEEVNWYRSLLALKTEGPEKAGDLLEVFTAAPPVSPIIRQRLPALRADLSRLQR